MDSQLQSPRFQQLWAIIGAAPIRVKVLGIVLGVILLLGGFVMFQIGDVLTNTLQGELEHQGIALAGTILSHLEMLPATSPQDMLDEFLQEQLEHYSNNSHNTLVSYILLEDTEGQVIAETSQNQRPTQSFNRPQSLDQTHLLQEGQILEVTHTSDETGTVLRLGLTTTNIHTTVNTVIVQLFTTTLIMVAIGFGAAFFLTWILTRPLLELVSATHAVARGDFSRRVSRWANDEIGELATAFNLMTQSLAQAETERGEREMLRERYVSGVIVAQENERQRIARELHDSTSQSLTSLLVGLQNLRNTHADDEVFNRHIDALRAVISATLDEVRTISWRLRPSALDDLGLLSALQHYVKDYQERFAIQTDLVANGLDSRLPLEIETAVYRIVQEGLTNIARYAQATTASVIINYRQQVLRIIVEDNGVGFDPAATRQQNKSLGLQGIRERAGLFNGKLTIESQPNQGTTLYIEIPYARDDPLSGANHDDTHSHR